MLKRLENKKKKGFTLIELIIVIAIIAILAAIAVPKFGQIAKNANIKADIATAKNLHSIGTKLIADNDVATPASGVVTDITTSVKGSVDGGTIPSSKVDKSKTFVVKINDKNDIIVYVDTTEVYPEAKGEWAK